LNLAKTNADKLTITKNLYDLKAKMISPPKNEPL
jgi:hypothetical protein